MPLLYPIPLNSKSLLPPQTNHELKKKNWDKINILNIICLAYLN